MRYDVAIVGGGPAGLSAALVLGRATRSVVVFDSGQPRNRAARAIHGYLTRDGITPSQFIAQARADLRPYRVDIVEREVRQAIRMPQGDFLLQTSEAGEVRARKVLLATGVRDDLPAITGFADFYGQSVHHCPYCDGWEHRGKRLAAIGAGNGAVGLALALRTWSESVAACVLDEEPDKEFAALAASNTIEIVSGAIASMEGVGGQVQCLRLASGATLRCDAVFFHADQYQRSSLPHRLGCQVDREGGVIVSDRQHTGVPGLFVAGDADREVQFVIVAAGQGATAAVAINRELQDEERGTRPAT